MDKTVCIDFDGVIHSYTSPWVSPTVIQDPPVSGAFDFISGCLSAGFSVAIFSSRSRTKAGIAAMRKWFSDNGFPLAHHLSFPDHKPPAVIYIDDRGFHFKGQFPSVEFIKSFIPWNRIASVQVGVIKRKYGLGQTLRA